MDNVSKRQRSWVMSRVKAKDTTPELAVRRAVRSLGLRYRLHRRDLPGTPDLVFSKAKIAVFVHGCFWHQHPSCKRARVPGSRRDYWAAKLQRNVARDADRRRELKRLGWKVIVIWECQTGQQGPLVALLRRRILRHMRSPGAPARTA